jgi:hypothetical protein
MRSSRVYNTRPGPPKGAQRNCAPSMRKGGLSSDYSCFAARFLFSHDEIGRCPSVMDGTSSARVRRGWTPVWPALPRALPPSPPATCAAPPANRERLAGVQGAAMSPLLAGMDVAKSCMDAETSSCFLPVHSSAMPVARSGGRLLAVSARLDGSSFYGGSTTTLLLPDDGLGNAVAYSLEVGSEPKWCVRSSPRESARRSGTADSSGRH